MHIGFTVVWHIAPCTFLVTQNDSPILKMETSRVLETFLQFHQTALACIGEDRDHDNEELSKLQKLPAC